MEKVQSICETQNEGNGGSWCCLTRVRSQRFSSGRALMGSAAGVGGDEPAVLGLGEDRAELLCRW